MHDDELIKQAITSKVEQKDIVLLSTADWDYPFWTNKQHTANTLATLGFRVLYIDSLGSRDIKITQSTDLKRIFSRLRRCFSAPKQINAQLWVWSPCILPINQSRLRHRINQFLFQSMLNFWLKKLGFSSQPICWTYNPLTLLYIKPHHFSKLIYHCVDNIAEQPNALSTLIRSEEKKLFRVANSIFVTSRALEIAAKQYSDQVHYFPNVVDFIHFNQACHDIAIPDELTQLPGKKIGFIGAISAYKINFTLLYEVISQNPTLTFVMIGKVGEGDPETSIAHFKSLKNIHFLGPKPYQSLPHYLKGLDACIIPANKNEYTKAMFPMKFFEYLAAAKPIVATSLDAISEYEAYYFKADNADQFTYQINQALQTNDEAIKQARIALAKKNTYLTRTMHMLMCAGIKT